MLPRIHSWKDTFARLGFVRKKRKNVGLSRHRERRLRMEALEDRQMLAITVNTPIDESDFDIMDGDVSLRDAVFAAALSGDTIDFAPGVMNGQTIALTLGELEIPGKSLTIDASNLTSGLTISAGHGLDSMPGTGDGSRIFNITDPTFGVAPPLVTLKNLTLTGGDIYGDGGVILWGSIGKQVGDFYLQCFCQRCDHQQGRISFATFHAANIGPMMTRLVRQFLLTPTTLLTEFSQVFTEFSLNWLHTVIRPCYSP